MPNFFYCRGCTHVRHLVHPLSSVEATQHEHLRVCAASRALRRCVFVPASSGVSPPVYRCYDARALPRCFLRRRVAGFFPKCLFGFAASACEHGKLCDSQCMRLLGAMGWRCCGAIERTTIVCEHGSALLWKRVVEILSRCADILLRHGGANGGRRASISSPVRARSTRLTMRKGVAAATWGDARLRSTCKLAVSAGSVICSLLLRRCSATTGYGSRYSCPALYVSHPGAC